METFVLLPFFLLTRVPSGANTWRHGPEYTFVANTNMTTLEGHSVIDFSVYQVNNTLKCRPRDFDTLHCQFSAVNITIYKETTEFYQDEDSWFYSPFDMKFDRRGIRSLVIPRDLPSWYLNMMRVFVSQMSFGVELLHKPDGAFNARESTYLGQCEGLINIFHEDNEISWKQQDYEIVPMNGLQKKRGETLVIEKTKNLENCLNKRIYMIPVIQKKPVEMRMPSSHSRIEISDMGFDSYTENLVDVVRMGVTYSFHEKISLNLISVLPAKEPLKPFSKVTTTVSPYVHIEED